MTLEIELLLRGLFYPFPFTFLVEKRFSSIPDLAIVVYASTVLI